MYRSRLQTEALHDLLEKLQKADFSPTAAFCVSTCCKLTEPEFTSLTSVNIRISSPDGPADRRSDALNTAVQTSAAVSIKDLKVVVKSRTGLKRRSTTTNNL